MQNTLPRNTGFARRLVALATLLLAVPGAFAAAESILPIPQQVESLPGKFVVDASTVIVVPSHATDADRFLARTLTAELAQRYGVALRTAERDTLPTGPCIVLGTWQNPVVSAAAREGSFAVTGSNPGPEGYVLLVKPDRIVVDGSDDAGAFYGLQSLRQLLMHAGGTLDVSATRIRDWPQKPFRAIKIYLPGRDNIGFYKRFIRDFAALYKYNHLFVEFNGAMRYDRHPEINAGWIDLFTDLAASRRDRPAGRHGEFEDSPNQDVADGGVLEKEEVADLVAWTRQQHIDFIPEVPSLSHAYYLLTRHRELADPTQQDWEWPDAYAVDNPGSHRLVFDVLDEVIGVTHPDMVLIGHDEWRVLLGETPETNSAARQRQYIADIRALHDYLAARDIKTAIYGDYLLEAVRGKGSSQHRTKDGHAYAWPGALTPEQVQAEIPKDILISNWFFSGGGGLGEQNEVTLGRWGYQQVFSNLHPGMTDADRRLAQPSVVGGVPASWASTTEFNFGKDFIYDLVGCANELWSSHRPALPSLTKLVQAEMPVVRRNLSGRTPASHDDPVTPLPIAAEFNTDADAVAGLTPAMLQSGSASAGRLQFALADPAAQSGKYAVGVAVSGRGETKLPRTSPAIPIGVDATSLVFLHALAAPATNRMAYLYIYNYVDSSDLLGYYEIVYDDGLVLTVPLRYGVNIAEWSWATQKKAGTCCYEGDAVPVGVAGGAPVTFFALEWHNPRLGRVIKEVRLHGSVGFGGGVEADTMENTDSSGGRGKTIKSNTILLRAISVVRPRTDLTEGEAQPPVARAADSGTR